MAISFFVAGLVGGVAGYAGEVGGKHLLPNSGWSVHFKNFNLYKPRPVSDLNRMANVLLSSGALAGVIGEILLLSNPQATNLVLSAYEAFLNTLNRIPLPGLRLRTEGSACQLLETILRRYPYLDDEMPWGEYPLLQQCMDQGGAA